MYLKCLVKIDSEDLKEFLSNFYDSEEIEDWNDQELQSQCTEALDGILSDHFSDYQVIDENTLVIE